MFVLSLPEFVAVINPTLARYMNRDVSRELLRDVRGKLRSQLLRHCVVDDAGYRVVDVAVSSEAVGDACRLVVEWLTSPNDTDDEDDDIDLEPDDPDAWRDCSEHHDDDLNEARDADGWPAF